MKTKQIVGILVAGLTFIIVCVSSALTKSLFSDVTSTSWKSFFEDLEKDASELPDKAYVGVLKVEGAMSDGGTSSETLIDGQYCHRALLNLVDDYMEDSNNKAILLYVKKTAPLILKMFPSVMQKLPSAMLWKISMYISSPV